MSFKDVVSNLFIMNKNKNVKLLYNLIKLKIMLLLIKIKPFSF